MDYAITACTKLIALGEILEERDATPILYVCIFVNQKKQGCKFVNQEK
jgi:hypothetical protein